MQRVKRRSVNQANINAKELTNLTVPFPTERLQLKIEKLLIDAYNQKNLSVELYQNAEQLLLNELGLSNWEPKQQAFTYAEVQMEVEENYSTVSLSKILKSDRLDAEFWDAAALDLLSKVNAYPKMRLGPEIHIFNGFPFQSKYFLENEIGEPFIRIRDCKPFFIKNERLTHLDTNYVSDLKVKKALEGDIVIGMDGIKWFYGSLVRESAYVNQRVCHVRINSDSKLTPEYVLLVINSRIGQMQLLRQMTIADTVGHIKNTDIAKLIIPDSININEITTLTKSAIGAQLNYQRYLALAKQAVEKFIKEDEKAALALIDSEV